MPRNANSQEEFELLDLMNGIDSASSELLPFIEHTKPNYETNWHHALVCQYLEKWIAGEITRLMVFMPSRHGKSEIISRRLPAYILGRNPNAQIIACSYGQKLAGRMNRDVQRIIESPLYRDVFPDTKLQGKNVKSEKKELKNSEIFEVVGHSGTYTCAGVDGGIVGMGMDFGILDDLYKNAKEANSPTVRQSVWDFYTQSFRERLEKENSRILMTFTRWHEDDLPGRLLAEAAKNPDADQWTVLKLPGLKIGPADRKDPRRNGEALWPNKRNRKQLLATKATIGTRRFEAMVQQNPTPPEGQIIERRWIHFYQRVPHRFDEMILSWDFPFDDDEDSDDPSYCVGQCWGRVGALKYLVDEVRDFANFPTQIKMVKSFAAKWPRAYTKVIEKKSNGAAVLSALKGKMGGLIAYNPEISKADRLEATSPQWEALDILLPDPSIAPWIHDWIEEIVGFPSAKYNDRVDACSQALLRFVGEQTGDFSDTMTEKRRGTIAGSTRGGDRW